MLDTDIFKPDQFMTPFVDPYRTAFAACDAYRIAIVMSIITNTAIHHRWMMEEGFFNTLCLEAEKFTNADHIVIMKIDEEDGSPRLFKKYDFTRLDPIETLELLQQLAIDLLNVYYEDVINFNYDESNYNGFYWNTADARFMIGYPATTESTTGDYEAIVSSMPSFDEEQKQLREYESRWESILEARQHGNNIAEDIQISTLICEIAMFRNATIYREVHTGADDLMRKIRNRNTNA